MLPPQSSESGFAQSADPSNYSNGSAGQLVPVNSVALSTRMPNYGWADMAPPRPEILTARPDPMTMWHAFRRKWLLSASVGVVVGLCCMALAYFFLPIKYEVFSEIRVAKKIPDSGLEKTVRQEGRDDYEILQGTQVAMVTSPVVLQAALRKAGISDSTLMTGESDKINWLKDNLKVNFVPKSEILHIGMRDTEPQEMVDIVNAVTKAYLTEVVGNARDGERKKLQRIEEALKTLRVSIQKDQDAISKISEDVGALANPEVARAKTSMLMNQIHGKEVQRARLVEKQGELSSVINMLTLQYKVNASKEKREYLIDQYLTSSDPNIQQISMQITSYEQLLFSESQNVRGNGGSMVSIRSAIAGLKQQLEDLKKVLRPKVEEMLKFEVDQAMAIQLTSSRQEFAQNNKLLEQLTRDISTLYGELSKVHAYSKELVRLSGGLPDKEKQASAMADQVHIGRIKLSLAPRIQKIRDAQLPKGKRDTARLVLVGFTGVFSFTLVVVGITYFEFLGRRIGAASHVSDGLGLTVLGTVPELSAKIRKQMAAGGEQASQLGNSLNEAIDNIRTMLMHTERAKATRVIMVTSAVDQEGKSTVASQLAASLSRAGKRTLLVDGDLRRPSVHETFGMSLQGGLCDVLRQQMEVNEVLRPTENEDLWVMTAGDCCVRSVQALAQSNVHDVFESLRAQFDFVIVDTAPVLAMADTLLMGQFVDAAILTVLRDKSQATRVYEAYERMSAVNIDVLGTVVSGENSRSARNKRYQLSVTVSPVGNSSSNGAASNGAARSGTVTDTNDDSAEETIEFDSGKEDSVAEASVGDGNVPGSNAVDDQDIVSQDDASQDHDGNLGFDHREDHDEDELNA